MHPVLYAFLSDTAADAAPSQPSLIGMLPMLAAMFAIFYFILWRPQAKERKKLAQWVANMKKGDEIVTQSGIIGTLVLVEDKTVTLDVGGGNKLRMLKTQMAGPWKPQEPAQPAKAEARK